MSRPRLHESLLHFFEAKDLKTLESHTDFSDFQTKYSLKIPANDFAQVFIHKSFSHEFNVRHQEQLEFLGDAVLQLILTEELYFRMPDEKEGNLSKLRSALVNEKSLANIARELGIPELVLVGKGEFKKRLFEQDVVLGDTFEALLAQIYRHHGLEFTKTLFLGWLGQFVPQAFDIDLLDNFDAKSKLQERTLAVYKKLPRYQSVQFGEQFEVSVWINEELAAKGMFSSKKNGEKELASEVLKKGLI